MKELVIYLVLLGQGMDDHGRPPILVQEDGQRGEPHLTMEACEQRGQERLANYNGIISYICMDEGMYHNMLEVRQYESG